MGTRSAGIRAGVVAGIAAGVLLVAAAPASAALPPVGTFPTWSIGGPAGAYIGTAQFASPTLASPAITSDSPGVSVNSGVSSYLGAGSGFGDEFGSTRAQPYLLIRPGGPTTVSTTTIDFTATGAPAAGWGFAVGDIDADYVTVNAFEADGTTPADPGFTGVGNYCAPTVSPKPSGCSGPGTDIPTWNGNTPTTPVPTTSVNVPAQTVYGNVGDTTGAYAWFEPGPTVRKITLTYGVLSGSPSFQLWIAQPAPATVISGTVVVSDGGAVPTGTKVQLDAADGTPVLDIDGDPVTTPVSTVDGTFSFTTEQRTGYQLQVVPPPAYATPAALTIAATTPAVTAPAITMDPAPATIPAAPAPAPELAPTGVDPAAPLLGAFVALVVGVTAFAASRRRRHR